MFESLKDLELIRYGCVVDGPHKGEFYFAHDLDYIQLTDEKELPPISAEIGMGVCELKIKLFTYQKHEYINHGNRFYLWALRGN